MKIECNKSYSFHIYDSNKCKTDLLYQKAENIRTFKNNLSNIFTIEDIINSKFDALKKYNIQIERLSGQEIQISIAEVHDLYTNKLDNYKNLLKVEIQKEIITTKYLKNGKTFKKDDIKTYEIIFKETNLTKAVSYLSKYWSENIIEHIKTQSLNKDIDEKKVKMYQNILFYIDKYGERIINLAKSKHQKLIQSVLSHRIEFESLNYRSLNRIKDPIIDWNKNKDSKLCNCFITLKLDDRIDFPTKYSHRFHGNLKDYQEQKSYSIHFKGNKPIKIQLSVEREEEIVTDKINYMGIDINVKNNLFYTSTEKQIDFDRKEFDEYIKFLKHMDEKKSKKNDRKSKLSNHDTKHFDYWKLKIKNRIKEKCSELVKLAKSQGKDHLVLEDLGQFGESHVKTNQFFGFKYSRLIKLLGLSNIKNIIKSIANKNEIQVTFVQSYYTSKMCQKCGYCHTDNRKSQEIFKCIECGFEINADFGAALKIEDRLSVDVLRTSLLNKLEGLYFSKRMSKQSIFNILYNCYSARTNSSINEEMEFS